MYIYWKKKATYTQLPSFLRLALRQNLALQLIFHIDTILMISTLSFVTSRVNCRRIDAAKTHFDITILLKIIYLIGIHKLLHDAINMSHLSNRWLLFFMYIHEWHLLNSDDKCNEYNLIGNEVDTLWKKKMIERNLK